MPRIRRIPALALALCLALLAGCANSPTPTEPVTLTVYTSFDTNRDMLDELAEQYTKQHPDTRIKIREVEVSGPPSQAIDDAALESGDILLLPLGRAQTMFKAGKLRDLSNVRLPELDELAAPLYDDLSMVNGRRIALPYALNPTVLLLNEARFNRDRVTLPPVDWTVEDWAQTHAALKAAGSEVNLEVPALLDPMVRAFGGRMYDEAKRAWAFDTPEAKAGLSWLALQIQNGAVKPPDINNMTVVGDGDRLPALSMIPTELILPTGLVLQPLPRGPKGRSVPVTAVVAGVLTSSAHPEQATDFVRTLISDPDHQLVLAKHGIRPVLSSERAMNAWRESAGDRTADAIDLSLAGAHLLPNQAGMRRAAEGLKPYFEGKSSLEKTIPELINSLPILPN